MITLDELIKKLQDLKEKLEYESKGGDEVFGDTVDGISYPLKDIEIAYYENYSGNFIDLTKIYYN